MLRFDHLSVVVDDLDAAEAFFLGLGFERQGGMLVEGETVDKINGLDGVRADVVMVQAPDGGSWLELWSDAEIAADPTLCVCAVWGAYARGDQAALGRWYTFARRGGEPCQTRAWGCGSGGSWVAPRVAASRSSWSALGR